MSQPKSSDATNSDHPAGPAVIDVADYAFTPDQLTPGQRKPGISAFMRVKNGADFVELAIRSHLDLVDEFVVVMNQATDGTDAILARLLNEIGPKLRVWRYLPEVHPPGSIEHASEPAESPRSFVTMSNFALTRTRYSTAVKIDDDHLAMTDRMKDVVRRAAMDEFRPPNMLCFSGLNIATDENGKAGILRAEPFSGGGDVSLFTVSEATHFVHDPRHETFNRGGLSRIYSGFAYWHLKYLKTGHGFANMNIETGSNPRFARKRRRFLADRSVVAVGDLSNLAPWTSAWSPWLQLNEKQRLVAERWRDLRTQPFTHEDFTAACRAAGLSNH